MGIMGLAMLQEDNIPPVWVILEQFGKDLCREETTADITNKWIRQESNPIDRTDWHFSET